MERKKNKPLFLFSSFTGILLIAFITRILAAIFSKGFVAHDDHFIPVETAYLWLSGQEEFFSDKSGAWRSPLYTLLHYSIFATLQKISISGAETQMFIVRVLHGIYSLLTVIYGYLFAKKLANKNTALFTSFLLATFWVFPYVSVHSLVESACVPPIVMGFYYSLCANEEQKMKFWVLAGFCFALAFTIRFQTFMLGAIIGLSLLFQKKYYESLVLLLATFLMLFVIMGIPDWIAYGYPFASFIQYSFYNINTSAAVTHPWYFYGILLLAVFLFPSSLLFIFGCFHIPKKGVVYLISSLSFVVFHSFFTNKQERFIIPAVFLLLILAAIGWRNYRQKKKFVKKKILYNILWSWFWFWNIALIIITIPTSTKKNLIQTLNYLSQKEDLQAIFIQTPAERFYLPRFYLQKSTPVFIANSQTPLAEIKKTLLKNKINYFIFLEKEPNAGELRAIENLQKISLKKEKTFAYNQWQNLLWGNSRGNTALKKIIIYKKESY